MLSKRIDWAGFAHSFLQHKLNNVLTHWFVHSPVNNLLTKNVQRDYDIIKTNDYQQIFVLSIHHRTKLNVKITEYSTLSNCLTSIFHNFNTHIQARNELSLLRFAPKGATAIINHLTGLMFNRNKTQNFIG